MLIFLWIYLESMTSNHSQPYSTSFCSLKMNLPRLPTSFHSFTNLQEYEKAYQILPLPLGEQGGGSSI